MGLYPLLNGIFIDHSPILFEIGDNLDIKYTMHRVGKVDFNEYMMFLHEAYKSQSMNLENEYSGSWSFQQ